MNFAQPWFLLGLSVLPVLWWLAVPPRPRAPTWTAHLEQYQAALGALRRRPPRRASWRLLLLAGAALAAACAAALPRLPAAPGPERLVIVVDASASMASHAAGEPSRFAQAELLVRERLATVPAHVETVVLRAGGPLSRRHGASARTLHDLGAPSGALAVDLPALAASIAAQPGTAVWTVTDGQGDARLPEVGALSVLRTIGDNAAVSAVRVIDSWPLPNLAFEVDVVAYGSAAGTGVVTASGGIDAPVRRELALAPGVAQTLAFDVQRTADGGELAITIAWPGDVLPTDDRAIVQLPALPAPRIAVLQDGETSPFARVAAATLAAEVGGSVVAPSVREPIGFLLVDGGRAAFAAGTVRALTFGSELTTGAASSAAPQPWSSPTLADWDRASPLTAGLDLSELTVAQAWEGILPPGQPFLWAEDGGERVPLAVIAGGGDCASLHFAFRLADSNLGLLPAFPQLLRRAFVQSYGPGRTTVVRTPPPPAGEQDLRAAASGADRPLPPFGQPARDLSGLCLLGGLLALAVRTLLK